MFLTEAWIKLGLGESAGAGEPMAPPCASSMRLRRYGVKRQSLCFLLLLLTVSPSWASMLELRNGDRLSGDIVRADETHIYWEIGRASCRGRVGMSRGGG